MKINRIKELTEYIEELNKYKNNPMKSTLLKLANKELKDEMIKQGELFDSKH
jgi:hypothetical protein